MDTAEQIVRELAESGPFVDSDTDACLLCPNGGDVPPLHLTDEPQHHDPGCLWRRARELYPAAAPVVRC